MTDACPKCEEVRLELAELRAIAQAAASWAESDACVIDDSTSPETLALYKAALAYVRLGYTL